jgi:tetratricopeptide (TPR) repeat protein
MKAVAVFIILITTSLAFAAEETPSEKLVKRGDRYYDRREKGRKWVERAKECYEKALALDTKSVDASWRLARAAYWLGDRAATKQEKLRLFQEAIDVTKRGVSLDDRSVECHFWLGISYAKYGEAKGIMESLALIEPIRKEMRRVIELDPSFAGGGAHRALGWIYHRLPGVAGGSNEKAVAELKKAIAFDQTHLLNHLCIADVYRKTGREKLARKHLQTIIDAPLSRERRPEEIEIKAGAKGLLEKMDEEE